MILGLHGTLLAVEMSSYAPCYHINHGTTLPSGKSFAVLGGVRGKGLIVGWDLVRNQARASCYSVRST